MEDPGGGGVVSHRGHAKRASDACYGVRGGAPSYATMMFIGGWRDCSVEMNGGPNYRSTDIQYISIFRRGGGLRNVLLLCL